MRWVDIKPKTEYVVIIEYEPNDLSDEIVERLPLFKESILQVEYMGASPCSYPYITIRGGDREKVQKFSALVCNRLRKHIRDIDQEN